MKKLMLNKGKAMACLILTCILLVSSCSKDRGYLLPQKDGLPVQNIKEETILKWIKANPSAKLLSLNWNKAMQAVVNGKNVVRVPTLNVDKLSLLRNNSSLKPNMLASSNLPPGSSGVRPKVGANANYFTSHPPELFFIQENDNAPLKTYLLNFVPKNESADFGQDGIWTGKLYEWNLNGDTVAVQEIEKNVLKVGYLLKYGNSPDNNIMASLKANKLQSNSGLKDRQISGFWDWFSDLLADGAGWVGSLLGISTDYRNTVLDGWRIEVDWHAVFASGDGSPNNVQSNGYQGAGLMIYSAYAAGYSNGQNLGGSKGGGYTPYHPTREFIELDPNDYIIGTLGITDPAQQDFLYTNLDIQIELSTWLDQHEHTPEANGFVRWAVAYLTPQPQAFNQAFRDLLNGVYNENSPIYIPNNFNIEYTQEWYNTEDELGSFITEFTQQSIHDTDPIPEMYYKNGTGIDMRPAKPTGGLTVLNAPRNKDYFWGKLAFERPEMFSQTNRARLSLPKPLAPIIDQQWVKYNPTHKSYMDGRLVHHHDGQGYMAFAIPEKVHQKWAKILHEYRLNGKMPGLSNKLVSLVSVMQIFSLITDVNTTNPDAWINWFAQQNETGKIYADPANNKYWEIMDQVIYKNSAGIAIKAVVHYNVYADFIWDSDEHRYMGVIKLNEFTEEVDLIHNTSKEVIKKWQ